MTRRFLVTGCGRSGTGFIAGFLTASGVPCGHEEIFTPTGMRDWNDKPGESSWFAAAMLYRLPRNFPVIHVVRHPRDVAASWYRLGLFAPWSWRLVVRGRPRLFIRYARHPKAFARRIAYVKAQRRLLEAAAPSVLEQGRELERIYRYWIEWNHLIENQASRLSLPYLRVQVEHVDWSAISAHIGHQVSVATDASLELTNRKLSYPARPLPDHALSQGVIGLARRYGYND